MRYRFIQQHQGQYAVGLQCRVLGVSVSGDYAWRSRPESRRARQNRQLVVRQLVVRQLVVRQLVVRQLVVRQLVVQIRAVFETHRHRYGSPRMQRELQEQGIDCSRKRVARLMQLAGLRARQRRRFTRTTDSSHCYPVAGNHLARRFAPKQVGGCNRVWAGDITYLATAEGWLYLAVLLDLHSRRVVGWAVANSLEQGLTGQTLERALALRQPGAGLLHHSDRGRQYAAIAYQGHLAERGMVCSMSRKGDCWDNAPVESFFATLKAELVSEFNGCFESREQARQEVGFSIR